MRSPLHPFVVRATSLVALVAPFWSLSLDARADAITDWNIKSGEFITESRLGTPPAIRVMALVQTAAFEAVKATSDAKGSGDAAVAAAHRVALIKLLPAQETSINAAYQAALAKIAEGPVKAAGITAGEVAANAVLMQRANDGASAPDQYRPHTTPGVYVPTSAVAVPQWPQRRPWLMNSAAQFRPAPPPALNSPLWVRDYNEIKALGSKNSTMRTAEQTEAARFWEYSLPAIYYGVVRSVATQPGRDLQRNARLYAAVAQAMDDGMIAIFDAKYTYNFWRPITAIRNGDQDGNDATTMEAGWTSFIESPLHPEYPSAHSILASSVSVLLHNEVGNAAMPELSTSSPTAKNAVRRWARLDDFVNEVSTARIFEGVHFRHSTEIGIAMGKQIGELAVARHLRAPLWASASAVALGSGLRAEQAETSMP